MGKKRYRSFVGGTLPEQQWQDLIIATALLLGADSSKQPMFNPILRTFGYPQAHTWQRCRKWLWSVHGMNVRRDGTIYQRPEDPAITLKSGDTLTITWTASGGTPTHG